MEKEFRNWMSRVAHAPTELFHGDGIYADANGCKRLAHECATVILDFGEHGEKNINSTYSAICVIAYNLHPPVDAKVWLGWMREKLDEEKQKGRNQHYHW